MKKVIVTTLILVLKILGAVIAAIKDFILYMVAILFTILISKGLFVSIAAISQNGFGDFFGNLFAEGFFGFVLLFIGGPAVLVIFAELIVFLIGAVGYVAHILNIISQYVLGKIVVFIDSICMKLYNLLPENDSIRNNQYFVYLVETSSYNLKVINIIALLSIIYYAFIVLNKLVVMADESWNLKLIYTQFTSNQQIICIIIGILFCLIARACGGEIFEEI